MPVRYIEEYSSDWSSYTGTVEASARQWQDVEALVEGTGEESREVTPAFVSRSRDRDPATLLFFVDATVTVGDEYLGFLEGAGSW